MEYLGLIDRYQERLPIDDPASAISLFEGRTPLLPLNNIAKTLAMPVKIYAKYEGLNPTGSFKDRGMTVAVTKAVELGSTAIICASTGNTSASAAAYAARAGLKAFVLIPQGKIAMGKLAQAMMHGATVIQIEGNFDDGMQLVKEIGDRAPVTIVNSINPYRLQGQKTAAFEVVEQLGSEPDIHCLPVGNAGNISAYWMGYSEYFNDNLIQRRPVMLGFQAEGAAPFLKGEPISNPETVATAIRIGNPQSWDLAQQAIDESQGRFAMCTDEEILAMQKRLADEEGIFCEPASAISVAGLLKEIAANRIPENSCVVCTLTGHGLKDPNIAISQSEKSQQTINAKLNEVEELILSMC